MDKYIPDVTFYMRERKSLRVLTENPYEWIYKTSKELFAEKRVIIFGLPGAFTPTCSNDQLPGYERLFTEFQQCGIDEIWCTSVNDSFAMFNWSKQHSIGNIKMLPDGNGEFAKGLGMLVDKSNLGFGQRSWRYAMLVDNLVIKDMFAEEGKMDNCPSDPYTLSAPANVLAQMKQYI